VSELSDPTERVRVFQATFVEVWLMAALRPAAAQVRDWLAAIVSRRCAERLDTGVAVEGSVPLTFIRAAVDDRISQEFRNLVDDSSTVWLTPGPPGDGRPVDGGAGAEELPLLFTRFGADGIRDVRCQIRVVAARAGLSTDRVDDLAVAVSEIITNVVVHGGGVGELYVWQKGALECEVRDYGHGFDADRYVARPAPPEPSSDGGMGLWMAGQLCDAMSISSGPVGTVARIFVSAPASPA
jgi:serine/threonine-protein kinase RsbW